MLLRLEAVGVVMIVGMVRTMAEATLCTIEIESADLKPGGGGHGCGSLVEEPLVALEQPLLLLLLMHERGAKKEEGKS
jgi:hypothetical protein